MKRNSRSITNKLLELVEEGVLDAEVVLRAALLHMSEADVAEMAEAEELIPEEDLDDAYDTDEDDEGDDEDEFPRHSRYHEDDDED